MQSRTIVVNGTRIRCLLGGSEFNPVVVLLHGWAMASSVYKHLGDLLSEGHFVIIPDLPGFGRSDKVSPVQFEKFAAILDDLLEQLGLSKVSLVAHSMGGAVAIKMAQKFPKRVEKVILVDSMGEMVNRGLIGWAIAAIYKTLRSLSVDHLRAVTRVVTICALNCLKRPLWMWQTFRLTIGTDLVAVLKTVKTETHLVWADKDEYFPSCQRMASAINTQPIIIPKAGHDWIILEPVAAAQIIKQLL